MAADAPTTDGSITPVQDTIGQRHNRQRLHAKKNDIGDANRTGQSNGLAIGFVLKFSLDLKRPVTEAIALIQMVRHMPFSGRLLVIIRDRCLCIVFREEDDHYLIVS